MTAKLEKQMKQLEGEESRATQGDQMIKRYEEARNVLEQLQTPNEKEPDPNRRTILNHPDILVPFMKAELDNEVGERESARSLIHAARGGRGR